MITIRFFENKDTDQIIQMILNIQQNEMKVPITRADQPDLEMIAQFYQKEGGNFWVACDGEKIVGTIALIDCGETVGCIRKMFVAKEYRGRKYNLAYNLINHLEAWAIAHHIWHIYLGTFHGLEAAMAFYNKNNYQLVAKENLPGVFPIMQVDDRFFYKNLKTDHIELINFEPKYAKDFFDINVEWISAAFKVEEHDIEQLSNPQLIINDGGYIILAKLNNAIVGTAVLIHEGAGVYEVAKMAVRPQAKGRGLGKMLCKKCIDLAKEIAAQRLYLVSNRRAEVAIKMYGELGFVEIPLGEVFYERADIKMEYFL